MARRFCGYRSRQFIRFFESNVYFTNPLLPDSDYDGLNDGDELNLYDTDPLIFDSDEDGIFDGEEVLVYGSDPNLIDSDGDQLADGVEVKTEFDPTKWDTDSDGIGDGLEFVANFGSESSAELLPLGFIRMTIEWSGGFAIITTNSTMLSASFDAGKQKIDFHIKGTSGTNAICNVTLLSSLVTDPNNLKVKIDENLIEFSTKDLGNMILIQFKYSHSEHNLSVELNGEYSQINTYPPLLFISIVFFAVFTISITKRRKFFYAKIRMSHIFF